MDKQHVSVGQDCRKNKYVGQRQHNHILKKKDMWLCLKDLVVLSLSYTFIISSIFFLFSWHWFYDFLSYQHTFSIGVFKWSSCTKNEELFD